MDSSTTRETVSPYSMVSERVNVYADGTKKILARERRRARAYPYKAIALNTKNLSVTIFAARTLAASYLG